ncbi:MAG: 3-hydroxyacyl-CoA dehydrogenase NAD-binding domain-containing protein [Sorangiineae bacterium]|nr:3-hydroxyacyl-CoA dehydrogenase NAD-binding domain-containing protein [Polyangiaceae bacterium]MEB2321113.1 3-hydroxyacyl-CoA dehydrogenase NAD-binding domain-containing protein [Sorangiineae bacterium]
MKSPVVRVEREHDVATLIIDNPPVNALGAPVLAALSEALDELDAEPSISALVVTGHGDKFIAGADLSRLERIAAGTLEPSPPSGTPSLPALVARLEQGPKPSVAAIDGFALGGGLELAMACAARVGTARCRLGLPELNLGLIPGAGGTQRLPRLVGVEKAVEMMLGGAPIGAVEARALGLLDDLVGEAALRERARELARSLATGAVTRRRTLTLTERLAPPDEIRALIARARADTRRKLRNVDYPGACLDAIEEGALLGAEAGLARERAEFLRLLSSEAARGKLHVFFATRAAAKVPGVTDAGPAPRALGRVGVLGGGTMGSGIATALVRAGVEVIIKEATDERAEAALARVRANLERDAAKGRLSDDEARRAGSRLTGQTSYDGFDALALVIEAASESVELKQQLFQELEAHTSSECILATNTSTIELATVSAGTQAGPRTLGLHFFSPAQVMRLVEVVRTRETSPRALVDALELVKRLKKTAVTVRSCPGFLVNRIFMRYGQACGLLIDRGVHPYRIDDALYAFGMPMGPNRMGDLAGLDVSVAAARVLDAAYPDGAYRSALRQLLVDAGRLGDKSGAGHYRHEDGRAERDPALDRFVAEARRLAGEPPPLEVTDDEIVKMLVFGVVNEACRALDEGAVVRASDVDVAAILGMGFPDYRGGPMKWADGFGARAVRDALARFHERTGSALFSPSALLTARAAAGASLLD